MQAANFGCSNVYMYKLCNCKQLVSLPAACFQLKTLRRGDTPLSFTGSFDHKERLHNERFLAVNFGLRERKLHIFLTQSKSCVIFRNYPFGLASLQEASFYAVYLCLLVASMFIAGKSSTSCKFWLQQCLRVKII